MQARLIQKERIQLDEHRFVEIVIWLLPQPLPPSRHRFKYSLAYVVRGECVVRFDNERGKGDHYHWGDSEHAYIFTTLEALIEDFWSLLGNWKD